MRVLQRAGRLLRNCAGSDALPGPVSGRPAPLPVGDKKGCSAIAKSGSGNTGWVYDEGAGTIKANCENEEVDAAGVPYNQY